MTVIALCSLKGSPGVTTTAVTLAATWPTAGHPVVIECDPAGGDLLARYRLDLYPGLVTLAAATRRYGTDPGLIWHHTQRLPGGLPVVPGPPGADQARVSLAELVQAETALKRAAMRPGTVVLADCGRVEPGSPTLPLIRAADILLLVAGTGDDALAHLATTMHQARAWSTRPRLLLVGEGYPTDEIAQALGTAELGVGIAGRLPYDPAGAAMFSGHPAPRTAPARSRLGQAAAQLAARVARDALVTHGPRGHPEAPRAAAHIGERAAQPTDFSEFTVPSTYRILQ
ncbi:MinD/ParA family protein [Streptomyces sp. NPDC127098]|uniref:MinD/ParA family ATP-binding protein n=1 Tax=Streptomyces sp. NPDC127098 TaxID=3347137 RepID=UPI00365FFE3A